MNDTERMQRAERYAVTAAALLEQSDAARRMSQSPTIHAREDFAREAAALEKLAAHNLGYGFAAALEINYYHGRADVDMFGPREALEILREEIRTGALEAPVPAPQFSYDVHDDAAAEEFFATMAAANVGADRIAAMRETRAQFLALEVTS